MKRFLAFYLSFSLLIFGQQSLFAKATFDKPETTTENEDAHQHKHSFSVALKMVLTGIAEHDHEHEHEDDLPWTDTHSPATKTHSHFDGHALKLDVVTSKQIVCDVFINANKFKTFRPKSHLFELPSRIFRPPINA